MWTKDHQISKQRALTLDWLIKTKIGVASDEIPLMSKGSSAQQKKFNARHATSLAITQTFVSRKPSKNKPITSTENPLHIS